MSSATAATKAVLRVHDEPCKTVHDWECHDALMNAPGAYMLHLHEKLEAISKGLITIDRPNKIIFTDKHPADNPGDFRVMPCVFTQGDDVWKVCKVSS